MVGEVQPLLIHRHQLLTMLLVLTILGLAACAPVVSLGSGAPAATLHPSSTIPPPAKKSPTPPPEVEILPIPLAGPGVEANAQISGLAWAGDNLVLLPQYPRWVSRESGASLNGGALLTLSKAEILAFLDDPTGSPLTPRLIPLDSGGLEKSIPGFEGFEALAFAGRQAYLAIEASPPGNMKSYVVKGELAADLSRLTLDAGGVVEAPVKVQIPNFSNEALLIDGERVILFYEANGAQVYPEAQAAVFDRNLHPGEPLLLANLEFRLTDATGPDEQGRFWVCNFFYPADLATITFSDPLAEQFGQGPSHAQASVVERLVELQLPNSEQHSIELAGTPPVQLRLAAGQIPRNWEGIARLDGRGFLLATDKFPDTILAFVPYTE